MYRTLGISVLVAGALAGVLSFASSASAQGGGPPDYLLCDIGKGKDIAIPIVDGDMRSAVAECLKMGGHPSGVARGKDKPPVEEEPSK